MVFQICVPDDRDNTGEISQSQTIYDSCSGTDPLGLGPLYVEIWICFKIIFNFFFGLNFRYYTLREQGCTNEMCNIQSQIQ